MTIRLNPDLKLRGLTATLKQAASEQLWGRGEIKGFLLDATQQEMAKEVESSKSILHTVLCSRRIGKSWMLVVMAIEDAIRLPNRQIKYITNTQRAARDIVQPLFREILSTCPASVKPEFRVNANRWIFPNGSEIALYGVDATGGDDLRGQACDRFYVDEAGFIPKVDVLVREILIPMIIQRGGRGVLSSTPPKGMDHPFVGFVAQAKVNKAFTKRTIYDCPRFTSKMIELFIEQAGGVDSEVFRREYLCEMIANSDNSIIPEFDDIARKEMVYTTEDTLEYMPDRLVSLDPGFADKCAILFGYWSFHDATLVIQREFVQSGQNTMEIAEAIQDVERKLWNRVPPYKRVSDTDLRLIQDLRVLHGLKFTKTDKDQKEAQINLLRIMVRRRQIRVHESCVNLLNQLQYGSWKTSASGHRDYKRTPELGHCDAIDCLLYMIRNINKNRNPIPPIKRDPYGYYAETTDVKQSKNARVLSRLFE